MSFSLPWFPDGDPTAPSEVSVWHRALGEYYQTYDLLITDQPLPVGLPLAYSGLLCERYTPYRRPGGVDWFERWVDWISKWAGYFVPGEVPGLSAPVQFPLTIGADPGEDGSPPVEIELHYLTWDGAAGALFGLPLVTVLSWVRETITLGQPWTPRYPVVPNSLCALSADGADFALPLTGSASRALLLEYWDFPLPSDADDEDADDKEGEDYYCINYRIVFKGWLRTSDPRIGIVNGSPQWVGALPPGRCSGAAATLAANTLPTQTDGPPPNDTEDWVWVTVVQGDEVPIKPPEPRRYILGYAATTTESTFTPAWVEETGGIWCRNFTVTGGFWAKDSDPGLDFRLGEPLWVGPKPAGACSWAEVASAVDLDPSFGIPPRPPGFSENWWWVEFAEGEPQPCQRARVGIPEGSRTVSSSFSYSPPVDLEDSDEEEDSPFYFYARTANNNFWGLQPTVNWEKGTPPVLYTSQEVAPDEQNTTPSRDFGPTRRPRLEFNTFESSVVGSIPGARLRFFTCQRLSQNIGPYTFVEGEYGGGTFSSVTAGFRASLHWDPVYTENPDNLEPPLRKVPNPVEVFDAYWLKVVEENGALELANVMPDSVRIKEIHTALEAHRFGSGSEQKELVGPDGESILIENTLAAQIEYTQEAVQGFNFPGTFQSYRYLLSDRGVESQEPKRVENLPELIYRLYEELALVLGPGAISSDSGENGNPYQYSSVQDQIDDVLSNQSIHFGVTSSLSVEAKRTLWILGQVLAAIGIPIEVQELDLGELGKVPVPRVSGAARSIRQAIDDVQINLTPRI